MQRPNGNSGMVEGSNYRKQLSLLRLVEQRKQGGIIKTERVEGGPHRREPQTSVEGAPAVGGCPWSQFCKSGENCKPIPLLLPR